MGASTEIEAKFMLPHLADMRHVVLTAGAHVLSPRILERNLRLDTPDGSLEAAGKVLRLRQDRSTRLTYKEQTNAIELRREIEIEVDDYDQALALLQALGFVPLMVYEKYRQIFELMDARIMMDELPFGQFVEVEADALEIVRRVAEQIGLNWEHRAQATYLQLFDCLRGRRGLDFIDATFANFEGLQPAQPSEFGLSYGSEP